MWLLAESGDRDQCEESIKRCNVAVKIRGNPRQAMVIEHLGEGKISVLSTVKNNRAFLIVRFPVSAVRYPAAGIGKVIPGPLFISHLALAVAVRQSR
jgi:hypothetical protein